MPQHRSPNAVRLEFAPDSLVSTNLSGAAFTGDWLWVAGDEACGLDRLRRLPPLGSEVLRFGEVQDFPLATLLDLPGDADEEADLEGMAVADGWLWVVGSHGLQRKNAKPGRDHADNAKRLAKLSLDGNRRLLACLPIEHDAQGVPQLVRQARDGRCARRLAGDAQSNALTRLLAKDPHFGPFMKIPGKPLCWTLRTCTVTTSPWPLRSLRSSSVKSRLSQWIDWLEERRPEFSEKSRSSLQ